MNEKNTLDTLLNIGASCDWITPLCAIIRDAANGPTAHFGVNAYGGFDRGAIRRLLSTNGIESWGYMYNVAGDLIMFSVPETQAQAAYGVMTRAGVPVLYAPNGAVPESEAAPAATLRQAQDTTMGNSFQTGDMVIVPAPSVWRWISRKLARKETK